MGGDSVLLVDGVDLIIYVHGFVDALEDEAFDHLHSGFDKLSEAVEDLNFDHSSLCDRISDVRSWIERVRKILLQTVCLR